MMTQAPPDVKQLERLDAPPHSVETEENLLGALLMYPEALDEIAAFLVADDFYIVRHGWIWDRFRALAAAGDPLDNRTVAEALRVKDDPTRKHANMLEAIGGEAYINYLPSNVPTALNAEIYGRIVSRAAIRRQLLGAAGEISQLAYDEDFALDKLMPQAQALVERVAEKWKGENIDDGVVSFTQVVKEHMAQVEIWRADGGDISTIKTPFTLLNDIILGYESGDFVVWGAEPSKGKSAALWQCATWAVSKETKDDKPVKALFIPLEMTHRAMASRSVAQEAQITTVQQRTMDDAQWARYVKWAGAASEAYEHLYMAPVTVNNLTAIKSLVRRYVRKHGVNLVFIDYLQLVSEDDKDYRNKTKQLENLTNGLQRFAIEMDIAIVTAAQLNREFYGKRPELKALRHGGIEQAATKVIFIYNDISLEEYASMAADADIPNKFIVAKNRNGPLGDVPMYWYKDLIKFNKNPRPKRASERGW